MAPRSAAQQSDTAAQPRTVFVNGASPWAGLMQRADNVRPLVPQPASVANAPRRPRRVPAKRVSVKADKLRIANDPPPQFDHPGMSRGRMQQLFDQLRPGQCLACASDDARRLANNLRQWLKARGRVERVVYRPQGGPDGTGRVWLMPANVMSQPAEQRAVIDTQRRAPMKR